MIITADVNANAQNSCVCDNISVQVFTLYYSLLDDPAMIERIRSTFVGHYSLDKVCALCIHGADLQKL